MRRYPQMADGVVVRVACTGQGVGEQLRHTRAAELLRRQADRVHHDQAHALTRRAVVKIGGRKEEAHGRRSKGFALCRRRWTLTASPRLANRVRPAERGSRSFTPRPQQTASGHENRTGKAPPDETSPPTAQFSPRRCCIAAITPGGRSPHGAARSRPTEMECRRPCPALHLRVPRHRSSSAVDRIGRSACTCIRPQVFQGVNKSGPRGPVVCAETLACLLRITPEPT